MVIATQLASDRRGILGRSGRVGPVSCRVILDDGGAKFHKEVEVFVCRRTDGRGGKRSNDSFGGRWFSDAQRTEQFLGHAARTGGNRFLDSTTGKSVTAKMETTMVDGNVLFSLELCALAVLVGAGVWRFYRTRQSAKINAAASVAHDMRQDRQRPSRPILDDACGRGDPALMFIL